VHLITFALPEQIQNVSKNVYVHHINGFKRYNIFAIWKLAKLINRIDPDIIHTHAAKATRIVYTIRNMIKAPIVGTKHNARKGKIFNKLEYVVAVSKDGAQSIKSDHVKIIYNGIEPVEVHPHETKDGLFHILAVGRLDKIKGFDILINECANLNFPFKLDIVGEGEERDSLERLIRSKNLDYKVRLVGFQKDIAQRMCDADMVVISSHSEGFSLVMVESLFYANTFVSTRVSGATEILEEKFLCAQNTLAAKINDVYLHQEEYQKAFAKLKDKLQHRFMLDTIADEYIVFYKLVINKMKG